MSLKYHKMKSFFKFSAFSFFAAVLFWGCEKEETKVYYQGGTPPALTATPGADFNYANADGTGLTLTWTNPEYMFTTGVNSHDVSYNIEIDTASDFSNPAKKIITVSKDLSYIFKVSDLNDIMLNTLNLQADASHTLQIRVISSLTNNSAQLISNTVQLTVTAYSIPPKVAPPASGTLYITGSATQASWQCGCGEGAPEDQTFTQVTPTVYELTTDLVGGGSYLFIPRYGTWNAVPPDPEKYGGVGANNTNNVNGDDFKPKGGDLLAPAESGTYKIVVDFQKGKFTLTKQ